MSEDEALRLDRRQVLAGMAGAAASLAVPGCAPPHNHTRGTIMSDTRSITREVYEGFQRDQLDRWDAVFAPDVQFYSPGYWGGQGLPALKAWGKEFIKAFAPRIDLVDESSTGDRPFITVNLNWKHVAPFFDLKPTGREGTSIELFLLTVKNGRIVRFQVADCTLDLAIYIWERGTPQAHNVRPEPIVKGIDRRG